MKRKVITNLYPAEYELSRLLNKNGYIISSSHGRGTLNQVGKTVWNLHYVNSRNLRITPRDIFLRSFAEDILFERSENGMNKAYDYIIENSWL